MIKEIMYSLFLVSVIVINVCHAKTSKIIIDNDAGGDDSMAIFLALLYEKYFDGALIMLRGEAKTCQFIVDFLCVRLNREGDPAELVTKYWSCPEVIGLTTGNGNTIEENVCVNNQKILKIAQRQEVPIYRGSKKSIVHTPHTNNYYGEDGMGDNDDSMTDLIPALNQDAVSSLIEQSKIHEGKLTVVTIGTLTNVALAMKLDPSFLGRLAHLYVGAGHIHNEDNPEPEFNAHMDVEAYHILAQHAHPEKVTVVPFSQTLAYLDFSKKWREEVLGAIDTEIMRAQNKHERVSLNRTDRWASLDPSVIAAAVKPDLVKEYKYSKNDIVVCGDKRGLNTNTFIEKDDANVRIVYSVKSEEYKQFLIDVFSAELQ